MITNVRIGNDIKLIWQILKGGQPVDLTGATDVKVSVFQGGNSSCGNVYIDTFKITDAVNGILSVEIPKEVITEVGYMWTVLEYTLHDDDMIDGDRKVTVDNVPVRIVSLTAEASQVYEFNVSSDILAGFHGKSAFEVWLDENPDKTIQDYFDWLQQPATDAGIDVQNQVDNYLLDVQTNVITPIELAEQGRVEAEIIREQQEEDRQINTATAISNAENATENANTAAQNADDARLSIQDDLALKADQADLVQLESDVKETTEKPTAQSLSELNARITALEAIISNKIKDRIDVTKEFNVWGKTNLILYGDGASSKTPDFIGQTYIDTTNGNVYIAVGVSNAGNWKLV